jgi:hypothetical protein
MTFRAVNIFEEANIDHYYIPAHCAFVVCWMGAKLYR